MSTALGLLVDGLQAQPSHCITVHPMSYYPAHDHDASSSNAAPNFLFCTGLWGRTPCTLGMGIVTFDIMAQLLSYPLVDAAHVWTTRWKTGVPDPTSLATSYDALQAGGPVLHGLPDTFTRHLA